MPTKHLLGVVKAHWELWPYDRAVGHAQSPYFEDVARNHQGHTMGFTTYVCTSFVRADVPVRIERGARGREALPLASAGRQTFASVVEYWGTQGDIYVGDVFLDQYLADMVLTGRAEVMHAAVISPRLKRDFYLPGDR